MWLVARAQGLKDLELYGFTRPDLVDPEEAEVIESAGLYWDDLRGVVLDSHLTRQARKEEVSIFRERRVYTVVPRAEMKPGAKLIGVRWVDTDKGQPGAPKV